MRKNSSPGLAAAASRPAGTRITDWGGQQARESDGGGPGLRGDIPKGQAAYRGSAAPCLLPASPGGSGLPPGWPWALASHMCSQLPRDVARPQAGHLLTQQHLKAAADGGEGQRRAIGGDPQRGHGKPLTRAQSAPAGTARRPAALGPRCWQCRAEGRGRARKGKQLW